MNWLHAMKPYEESFITDLRGLLQIPSIKDIRTIEEYAPFGKPCRDALDYMLTLAASQGFVTKDIDGYAGVIEYGEGQESVGVLAHLDVVPIGKGWSKDPFAGEIVDGYLFGRGVIDDKGPAMASFYALKMLRDRGIKLNKKAMLILGCDEESGMHCMDYYVQHAQIPTLGFTPDASFPVIYGEKGGMHIQMHGECDTVITKMHAGERANIVIGEASAEVKNWQESYYEQFVLYLKANDLQGDVTVAKQTAILHIKGVFAHAATPYQGVNAALHMLHFIACAYGDTFASTTYHMLNDWQGKPLGIDIEGAHMGCLTMNTGIIHIDEGEIRFTIDVRYPNDACPDVIMNGFHATAQALKYPLAITLVKDVQPLFVDPNATFVTTLANVYKAYTKEEDTVNRTIGGGTYAKKMPNFVAFGPKFPKAKHPKNMFVGGCHQKDEAMKLEELYMATAIYADAIEKLAN